MAYVREVEPGCDGLDPAGELRYGVEYRVEFPDGSARRYQAVLCETDFSCVPIGGGKDEARRFLEAAVEGTISGLSRASTPDALDRELAAHGFVPVIDAPQLRYKLWQRVVRTPPRRP